MSVIPKYIKNMYVRQIVWNINMRVVIMEKPSIAIIINIIIHKLFIILNSNLQITSI